MILVQDKAIMQNVDILTESTDEGVSKLRFRAHLQDTQRNNNGRIYNESALGMIHSQLAPKAKKRKLVGEHGHPLAEQSLMMRRMGTIDPGNVSVLYTNMTFDKKNGIQCEAETLTTTKGLDLYNMIRDNVAVGFSYRGFGRASGNNLVESKTIKSITYDVVFNESNNGSVVIDILNEGTNTEYDMIQSLNEATDDLQHYLMESEGIADCPAGQCNIDNISMLKEFLIENIQQNISTDKYKKITLKLR